MSQPIAVGDTGTNPLESGWQRGMFYGDRTGQLLLLAEAPTLLLYDQGPDAKDVQITVAHHAAKYLGSPGRYPLAHLPEGTYVVIAVEGEKAKALYRVTDGYFEIEKVT